MLPNLVDFIKWTILNQATFRKLLLIAYLLSKMLPLKNIGTLSTATWLVVHGGFACFLTAGDLKERTGMECRLGAWHEQPTKCRLHNVRNES